MARLTDIKTPEHYPNRQNQPKKRSFFKTFFKVITAPVWAPFYLVYLVLRAIKNLIVKTALFIGRGVWFGLLLVLTKIKTVFVSLAVAVQNAFLTIKFAARKFFNAVTALVKNFLFNIPRFLPNNWAAWLVFLLGVTLTWQTAAAWDFPLLNLLDSRQGKWQAVFLSNDQVYFGRLRNIYGNTAILENVFYLRNREGNNGTDLVRLGNGNELHNPENTLFIPREQIVFWENLKEDSQVVKLIEQLDSR